MCQFLSLIILVAVAVLDYINRVAVIWMTVYPGGT